jgi:nitroreductase
MMSSTVWQVDEKDFPLSGDISDKIRFLLRYAILAPSAHNTQPWRVEIDGNMMNIFRDPAFTLRESDATLRETFLGLGAFLENFVVAASHFGYKATLTHTAFMTKELLIATIALDPSPVPEEDAMLFAGILQRHTNRGTYDSTPLTETQLRSLEVPADTDTVIAWITDSSTRARIAGLVGQSTAMALSVNTMRRELAELTFREKEQQPVGMMVEALTETASDEVDGPQWVAAAMNPAEHGAAWHEAFAHSPLHVLIGTRADGPAAWLSAGRTMERVLLNAAAQGLSHCISAGPIEVPTLLPALRQEIEAGYRPQALFRLGIAQQPNFTRLSTRRTVEAVVTEPLQ